MPWTKFQDKKITTPCLIKLWLYNVIQESILIVTDSYFTERYLGEPSKQPQAYDNADLTMRAGNLYNRQYLLIHGTADTVVIPQHSMMFAKALIEQGVLFQQLVSFDC